MTGKTISTTITNTVTLGSGSYPSPLTITSTGEIGPSTTGAIGIDLPNAATLATIVNHGVVDGGYGGYNADYYGLNGGTAILLDSAATLTNTGSIFAGAGGNRDEGGNGGIGIDVAANSTIVNSGYVAGGPGGYGHYSAGAGGVGIELDTTTKLTNSGVIRGGSGGVSYSYVSYSTDGFAAAAVIASREDVIDNTGIVIGGYGGVTGDVVLAGAQGMVFANGGTLTNGGTISGGGGGGEGSARNGALGGDGVDLDASSATNTGFISGGSGGYGALGGTGGTGIALSDYGSLTNQGLIAGGAGGGGNHGGPTGGYGFGIGTAPGGDIGGNGLDIGSYAAVINSAHIVGGVGGSDGTSGAGSGNGGDGVAMTGGGLTNHGSVTGGAGGVGNGAQGTGNTLVASGDGGIGILATYSGFGGSSTGVPAPVITNYGLVTGGAAGAFNGASGTAGAGGIGLSIAAGTASNSGTIVGGAGGTAGQNSGASGTGGLGGTGAVISGPGELTNTGEIIGGAGGASVGAGRAGGTGVIISGDVTLTNQGTIIGGAAATNGTVGGDGVIVEGGTFIDSGLVKGGAGTAQGDAIRLTGTAVSTLELTPSASLSGFVDNDGDYYNALDLTGTSTTTLTGVGTQFRGFYNLSFASGAQRIVEGVAVGPNALGDAAISGFAAHDILVLDNYTADLADTTIAAPYIDLFNGTYYAPLDLQHRLAKDLIISDGNGKTTITGAVGTLSHTLSSTAEQYVFSGGLATGTTLNAGSHAEIYNGGTAASFKLAGGTLELSIGAKVTGGIGFTTVKGGELILDSATMPTATISGFIAGDSIKLAGVAYNSHDTVTVKTAGIVSIVAPGITYNLNAAGATVGETGFKFNAGSVLTSAATAASVMAFLSPKDALYTPGHMPMDMMLPHAILTGYALATEAQLAPVTTPQPAAAPLPPVPRAYLAGHTMTLSNHAPLTLMDLTHHL